MTPYKWVINTEQERQLLKDSLLLEYQSQQPIWAAGPPNDSAPMRAQTAVAAAKLGSVIGWFASMSSEEM